MSTILPPWGTLTEGVNLMYRGTFWLWLAQGIIITRSVKSGARTLKENLTDSATVVSSVESSAIPV